MKDKLGKKQEAESGDCTCPLKLDRKVAVLEVNLQTMETRVSDFGNLVETNATAMDNKLDIVLQELKEFRDSMERRLSAFGERMARTEQDVAHILRQGRPINGD